MILSDIRLSIALVTRNRPEILERCLESWISQTVIPFEIVISDDSDWNITFQIQKLAQKYNCVYTKGPQKGLYANRNHASLNCRGTHILSADDDHTHPIDYTEKIIEIIKVDTTRIWIFTERHPNQPNSPLICPAEITKDGGFRTPENTYNCSAIADGSTVYPHLVFERGLKYDETYPFGGIWYLWGVLLVKNNWSISFSDRTFVWHHTESSLDRAYDENWLRKQIQCNLYVLLVNAFLLQKSYKGQLKALLHVIRCIVFSKSVVGYKVKVRMSPFDCIDLFKNVCAAKIKYYLIDT
jgi:glycosyltransferase involved in cell wall biosynthesis